MPVKELIEVSTPTLLINESLCRKNISTMVERAHRFGKSFRPHFKTHQSKSVGDWFKDLGVYKIAVSNLGMAEYFAFAGWDDIMVAIPVNVLQHRLIDRLSAKIHLSLVVDNEQALHLLAQHTDRSLDLFIELDIGQNRSGIPWDEAKKTADLVQSIEEYDKFHFAGFMVHGGHTYDARDENEIRRIHEQNLERIRIATADYLLKYPDLNISYGDTPSCSVAYNFDGVNELRPGNFVFYDLMQVQIGACMREHIAVATVAPIIGVYPDQNKAILYAGAAHLSKDSLEVDGKRVFGEVVFIDEDGWKIPESPVKITKLSQEHARVEVPSDQMHNFEIGKLVGILPVHSCLTANMMNWYRGLDGSQLDHMLGSI